MLVAVILASGRGTRLKPLSTSERPKQYLTVLTGKTLVEDTIDRVRNVVDLENIFVVTNKDHESLAKNELSFLNDENFIIEPDMKETLASMSHSVSYISKLRGKDVKYLFLPSDHYIDNIPLFDESIKEGLEVFNKYNNIVLYGLKPRDPNPEYGYIQTSNLDGNYLITSFVEKPKLEIAEKIYNNPFYFWNNAIMLANEEMMLDAIKNAKPEQYNLVKKHMNNEITTKEFFEKTYVDNFSRSILEHRKGMMLVPAKYGWFDIGGFDSLYEVLEMINKVDEITKIKKLVESSK